MELSLNMEGTPREDIKHEKAVLDGNSANIAYFTCCNIATWNNVTAYIQLTQCGELNQCSKNIDYTLIFSSKSS